MYTYTEEKNNNTVINKDKKHSVKTCQRHDNRGIEGRQAGRHDVKGCVCVCVPRHANSHTPQTCFEITLGLTLNTDATVQAEED